MESQNSSSSLFPAYQGTSSSSENGPSLFPAYSSYPQGTTEEVNTNKDWLCNSSYSPSNFQEVFEIKREIPATETESNYTKEKKKKKKHKKDKKKYSKTQNAATIPTPNEPESNSIRSQLNRKTFIEETGLSFERAFRVDPNCDRENTYYDSFEKMKSADYKISWKNLLGCSHQEQLLFIPPELKKSKDSSSRYFSKKAVQQIQKSLQCKEILPPKNNLPLFYLEFVPLSQDSKTSGIFKKDLKSNFDGVSTSWKLDSAKSEKMEASEIIIEDLNDEYRKKTMQFNKQLADSPHNIQLWLDFVDFQEELYQSKSEQTTTESFLVEKKIAILDKALKYNPKSVTLNIAKLNLCRNVWKIEKVIEHWDNLIFLNPNDPSVWQGYVTFVLTDLTYFSVPRVLRVFSKCLKTLSNLSEGIIQSHVVSADIVYNMLDLFNQVCFIMKSCGYTEKAVAAYQALIEFNLFDDEYTRSLPVSEKISCFEPFWDSGAARFGEAGAIGWSETVSQQKISVESTVFQSDLSTFEDDILCKKLPEWKTWLELEKLRELHHWLPWKPNPEYDQTDDDIEDIDRTVSFEDISKFLFSVPTDQAKFLLVKNFIHFLGFNPHVFECCISTHCETDTPTSIYNYDIVSKALNNSLFKSKKLCPLNFIVYTWTKDRVSFVKNIFNQAMGFFSLEHKHLLSCMFLKFLQYLTNEDPSESLDSVKKCAKNLLKEAENRSCLLLWFEYIKIESLSGSDTKARKTFETLFASSITAINNGLMGIGEVWYFVKSFIEFSLHSLPSNKQILSKSEIIWILIHLGCTESYSPYNNELIKPTMILKATSGFKCFLNSEMNMAKTTFKLCYCLDPQSYSFLDCAKNYAYLQYFTQGLDAAIQILEEVNKMIEDKFKDSDKRNLLEDMCTFQANLLSYHTKTTIYSMKPLFNYLYNAIQQYPDSGKLLLILLKWKSASSVVSSTRRFFAKVLKDHYKIKPITWIFAIAAELTISYLIAEQNDTKDENDSTCMGLKWKIRTLYEKAINSSLCSHVPILWRSYLKFEMMHNEEGRTKSVIHRAMQNCGWSKELLLEGIECFPEDLNQTIDFMVEKQIRVHTPLEEVSLLMEHTVQDL